MRPGSSIGAEWRSVATDSRACSLFVVAGALLCSLPHAMQPEPLSRRPFSSIDDATAMRGTLPLAKLPLPARATRRADSDRGGARILLDSPRVACRSGTRGSGVLTEPLDMARRVVATVGGQAIAAKPRLPQLLRGDHGRVENRGGFRVELRDGALEPRRRTAHGGTGRLLHVRARGSASITSTSPSASSAAARALSSTGCGRLEEAGRTAGGRLRGPQRTGGLWEPSVPAEAAGGVRSDDGRARRREGNAGRGHLSIRTSRRRHT